MTTDSHDVIGNATAIIDRFGGIRPMSAKTGIPVTTIQGWKKRNAIPLSRLRDLQNAAMLHQIDVDDLLNGLEMPEEPAESVVLPMKQVHAKADPAIQQDTHNRLLIGSAIVLFAAAALGAVFAVTPQVRKLSVQEQRIRDMEARMAQLQAEKEAAIPSELEQKLAGLQGKISELSAEAQYYKDALNDIQNGPMSERLNKVEGTISHLVEKTHAYGLQDMLHKLRALQSSPEGMGQIQSMMDMFIANSEGAAEQTPDQLAATFQKMRASDPKIAATFKDVSDEDMRAAIMLVGMSQLRNSLSRDNDSFEQDLKILKMTAAKDDPALQQAIDRLAPKAKAGVLTPDGLSRELRGLTGEIVAASLSGENVSIEDKALARVGNIMTVEKGGAQVSGTETQKKIAEAQKKLDAGDVAGAMAILNGLQGPAAEKAKPFMMQAQDTLMAGQLQQLLSGNIAGKLKGMAGGSAPYMAGGGLDDLLGPMKGMLPDMPNISGSSPNYMAK